MIDNVKHGQTWRELLGKAINDTQERQRIADVLGVNPVTLTRWVTNKSSPRIDNLRLLLQALPNQRQQLIELIQQEFPAFLTITIPTEDADLAIPSAFYERVLKAYATSPLHLRTPSIRLTIVQQILVHLDPVPLGMAVAILPCVSPAEGQNVRSLREEIGRGNLPWRSLLENHAQFVGIESPPGLAVSTGHPVIVQSREEKVWQFPAHLPEWEESALAQPIMLANSTAGCLYISSTQQNYFSLARQNLIRSYAELLVLAFEQNEFYGLQAIELGVMPAYAVQKPYLAQFHQRVIQYMAQAHQEKRLVTRPQAESIIWREMEDELLHLPYHSEA